MLNVYEAFIKVKRRHMHIQLSEWQRNTRALAQAEQKSGIKPTLIEIVRLCPLLPAAPEELTVVSGTFSQLQGSAAGGDCTRAAAAPYEQV